MLEDDKRPGDGPKDKPKEGPDEEPKDETDAQASEDDADAEVGLNRAERRRRKHGRKGELRQLHDRDRSMKKDTKGHGGRVFRRKSF
jgi:hypothetical protein